MSTEGLHNTALCQPYYVNQPRPVKFFQAAAKLEKAGSCAVAAGKLHKKSLSWVRKFVSFSNVKTLDKFKNL